MKTALVFFSIVGLCFGGDHTLILELDGDHDIADILKGHELRDVRRSSNDHIYRVVIRSNMDRDALIDDIYIDGRTREIEPSQRATLITLEQASSLDSRAVSIIDVEPFHLDTEQTVELNTRAMFIIESDKQALLPIYEQYHIYHTNAHLAWDYATGANVTVAIIDTGVDTSHELLAGHLVEGYDFVDNDSRPDEERDGLDYDGDGLVDEGYGHGTHVAGIVRTLAPGASIMPIRTIDSDGGADLFHIVEGVRYAMENGADIINLSMSVPEPSTLLERTLDDARRAGIVVITSAGNANTHRLEFPATEGHVLTVTSIGPDLIKSVYANYGGRIDVSSPGEDITSAHPGNLYVSRSGTSMAAPMVAAQAALIIETIPGASPSFISHRIRGTSMDTDPYNPNYRKRLGRGMIDMSAALQP